MDNFHKFLNPDLAKENQTELEKGLKAFIDDCEFMSFVKENTTKKETLCEEINNKVNLA